MLVNCLRFLKHLNHNSHEFLDRIGIQHKQPAKFNTRQAPLCAPSANRVKRLGIGKDAAFGDACYNLHQDARGLAPTPQCEADSHKKAIENALLARIAISVSPVNPFTMRIPRMKMSF